ncbi:TetR/AcrR family transcriptional regulator [Brevibacterium metallidurans]|uniref:TetR family transcriptional regulator C-terminal domain-containing protein n=1 Tax=Brevibacterium metallidurans TaxID=1482676 RepID=A0ABP3CDD6_9MICO
MSRKSASARREEILAATIDEIETTGLRALRVADVAARLGLSPSLVIYHFQTKEALVAAAFAHAGENDLALAREIAGADEPATERLTRLLTWYLPSGSTRSWTIWMDAWSSALFDEQIRSTLTVLDEEWHAVFAGVIRDGVQAGEFAVDGGPDAVGDDSDNGDPVDTNPDEAIPGDAVAVAATRILAFLDGLSVRLLVRGGEVERATMIGWVTDFADSLLGRDEA